MAKAKPKEKCGGRASSIRLDEDIYVQVGRVMKVIDSSPASKGNVKAKSTTALRHAIIIGLGVIELMGDGYQSPQHAIEQIKKAMEVN